MYGEKHWKWHQKYFIFSAYYGHTGELSVVGVASCLKLKISGFKSSFRQKKLNNSSTKFYKTRRCRAKKITL